MVRAAIGIGSNAATADAIVRAALDDLAEVGTLAACSKLYRTLPWGVIDQPPFVNAAALIDTELAPHTLLAALKAMEVRAGRVPTYRWGPRVLDLDILTYGDESIDEADLVVPHPRLLERAFVLVPLAEIDARFASARDALAPGERAGVVEEATR